MYLYIYIYIYLSTHNTPGHEETDQGADHAKAVKLYFVVEYDDTRSLARRKE